MLNRRTFTLSLASLAAALGLGIAGREIAENHRALPSPTDHLRLRLRARRPDGSVSREMDANARILDDAIIPDHPFLIKPDETIEILTTTGLVVAWVPAAEITTITNDLDSVFVAALSMRNLS